jgi:alpha-L-fucosidase
MPYQATRASLRSHPVPEWFHDAKLGVFVHWGPYSVPGYAPLTGELRHVIAERGWSGWFASNPYAEWYENSLRLPGSPTHTHHSARYGAAVPYARFAEDFNQATAAFDPEPWADLCVRLRARYLVLTTKHHDGFTLWPSRHANPRRPGYHARRDLVGEVARAVRGRGLRFGVYYSGGVDWTFDSSPIRDISDLLASIPQEAEYVAYADAHWRELIDEYAPSVLWNDIGYPAAGRLNDIFAYYYNTVADGVVNDRFGQSNLSGARGNRLLWAVLRRVISAAAARAVVRGGSAPASGHFDFRTPEYATLDGKTTQKWEATRGLGYSFGYNQLDSDANLLPADELVRSLVDIVSKNGNLLINIGPMADGTIPTVQRERLLALAAWLATNGEAIFGTRPWLVAEGRSADGVSLRFTHKNGALYALLLGLPRESKLLLEGLRAAPDTTMTLLGHAAPCAWTQEGQRLAVQLPPLPPAPAYALKITPVPQWLGAAR